METCRAMLLEQPHTPLRLIERAVPAPGPGEVLIKVSACGVCRTDLHVVDGEIPARSPIVPGHEIVGRVEALGEGVGSFSIGDRIGIPWLGWTCGTCSYCSSGRENLCDRPEFTGCTRDGGYATHAVADARYCFALPTGLTDVEAAPLLCAGLIGWRALSMAGEGRVIGLYGFGAAAHIIAQVAAWQGREVYAFTRPADADARQLALKLGCTWAGSSEESAPQPLDAAIIFAPVGALVPQALRQVRKGGRVVCAGIHMSDIPSFPYADLWGERTILSVANLTRADGHAFFQVAMKAGVRPVTQRFALGEANEALERLREGRLSGAAVIVP
ncbi:zinc-dependent alcohol dehydrogenase family protein [Sphingomonas sp. LaA6.9]|uniref:zinc-dependent alcohol dehydrogenase family protein n=1 Tax=Sphingomonas sp. LaA6.9 TaxID=2919914 RepID=UPI001F4F1E48|nr:zinc-dependent alcohol dehydrogenase family protein [Sphingomonas sp. LaA6.9]MCJ8157027.1 zinc-dependent alcohol dehydrogenase family protein [Sphingomonas sp. LaA6.9]